MSQLIVDFFIWEKTKPFGIKMVWIAYTIP